MNPETQDQQEAQVAVSRAYVRNNFAPRAELQSDLIMAKAAMLGRLNESVKLLADFNRKNKPDGPPTKGEHALQSVLDAIKRAADNA